MPWVAATLRGQSVFARADEAGQLSVVRGKVEIRYRPKDGRAYHALPSNLVVEAGAVHPDDFCVPADAAASARGGATSARSTPPESGGPGGDGVGKNATTVYTDGACSGNPGPAGCGFVVVDKVSGKIHEGYEYLGTGTNNIAELTAVLRGLEAIADLAEPVRVHTDSSYSIGVLQKGWKAKANTELVDRVRAELRRHPNARLVYVPGHAGVPLNERADALAREAIRTRGNKALAPI